MYWGWFYKADVQESVILGILVQHNFSFGWMFFHISYNKKNSIFTYLYGKIYVEILVFI